MKAIQRIAQDAQRRVSTMSRSIPIVLCGKSAVIGQTVIAGLKPEFEVIYFVMSSQEGASIFPNLLQNPPHPLTITPSNALGSKDYTRPPAAILIGGGYLDEEVELMREATKKRNGLAVPWVRMRNLAQLKPEDVKPGDPRYAEAVLKRSKDFLQALEKEEKLGANGTGDDVYFV